MMKIQVCEADGQFILQIEGRLAGAYVPELEECWQKARAVRPARQISLDLQNVTCVDYAGRYLLQLMHCKGVPFLRANLAIQDLVGPTELPNANDHTL